MKCNRTILIKFFSAVMMMAALLLLTTANYWVYKIKKDKQLVAAQTTGEEEDGQVAAPNPVEEKSGNGLQNLSEYLHDHSLHVLHPIAMQALGNTHYILQLPTHHPDLLTPPPKRA